MSEEEKAAEKFELLLKPEFQYQCKLCIWSREHPELYNWVCKQALDGYPPGRIATMLIDYVAAKYPDLKAPTKKSIWNHFNKHTNTKDGVKIQSAKDEFKRNPNKKLISESALEEIKSLRDGNFDEHEELCKLYVKFREVHDQIYEMADSLKALNSANGDVWSQNKIQTFTSMINTQKGILAEISKMRQGNKLITVATQYIIETFTKSIVTKLSDEFASLVTIMKRQQVDGDIIEAVEDIVGMKLASILVNEAEVAMGRTRQEFRLPN